MDSADNKKETWLEKEPSKSAKRSKLLKEAAKRIATGGGSNHSARGDTLKILLNYLEQNRISYQLTAHPGYGYYIQGLPREEWMDKNE